VEIGLLIAHLKLPGKEHLLSMLLKELSEDFSCADLPGVRWAFSNIFLAIKLLVVSHRRPQREKTVVCSDPLSLEGHTYGVGRASGSRPVPVRHTKL
jgi:hypothetical protein